MSDLLGSDLISKYISKTYEKRIENDRLCYASLLAALNASQKLAHHAVKNATNVTFLMGISFSNSVG